MGGDEKKSSYCSLQTDKLLASPWGHRPLSILTALHNCGRKQALASGLERKAEAKIPSVEATRKERDFCGEQSLA